MLSVEGERRSLLRTFDGFPEALRELGGDKGRRAQGGHGSGTDCYVRVMIEGGYWGSSGSDEGITTAIRRREEDTERRSSEQGWKLEADYFSRFNSQAEIEGKCSTHIQY